MSLLLAIFSALRILTGRIRAVAGLALATVLVLAVFSTWFLVIPVVAAAASLAMRRSLTRRCGANVVLEDDEHLARIEARGASRASAWLFL